MALAAGWTLPNKGEGDDDLQSIPFRQNLEALTAGMLGQELVLSGCAVTGGASMTPAVAKGAVVTAGGNVKAVAAGTVTIGAAHATLARFDLIVVDSSGALQVRAGTAAANPKPVDRTANDVILAEVLVKPTVVTIPTSRITDQRFLKPGGVTVAKTTTAVTWNTQNVIKPYFTTVLPSGLLLAGKQLEVCCGGNYLSNSGVPTWTLQIDYGGTILFQGATAATVADTDRGVWEVTFVLNASANAVQQMVGRALFQTPGVKNAPTNGFGDLSVLTHAYSPLRGAGAVDSDAADRTLNVQWTMSVSNVNVETVMDYGFARLI